MPEDESEYAKGPPIEKRNEMIFAAMEVRTGEILLRKQRLIQQAAEPPEVRIVQKAGNRHAYSLPSHPTQQHRTRKPLRPHSGERIDSERSSHKERRIVRQH